MSKIHRFAPLACSNATSLPSAVCSTTVSRCPTGGARTSLDTSTRHASAPSTISRATISPAVVPRRIRPFPIPTPPVTNDGSFLSQNLYRASRATEPIRLVQITAPSNRFLASTTPYASAEKIRSPANAGTNRKYLRPNPFPTLADQSRTMSASFSNETSGEISSGSASGGSTNGSQANMAQPATKWTTQQAASDSTHLRIMGLSLNLRASTST